MIEELEAPLGLYLLNQALIRLESDVNVLTTEVEEGDLKISRLAVLCHEYAHYLHNFSTRTGVYQFVAQLRLLRLFTHTVDEEGHCGGSARLSELASDQLASTLVWLRHLTGTTVNSSQQKQIQLHSISYDDPVTVKFANQTIALSPVTVDFYTCDSESTNPTHACKLGSHVITEGLAWEVERLVYQSVDESTHGLDQRTPQAPYKLARRVFERVAKCSPDSETMAKILLVALFSSDPGLTLVGIAKEILNRGAISIEAAFEQLLQRTPATAYLDETIELLKVEIDGFAQGGPAGRGIAALAQRSIDLLEARKANLFFEIDAFKRIVEPGVLSALINQHPPCPILQVEGDSTGLILLGAQNPDQSALNDLGAAQAMMQFMWNHIDSSGIVETNLARSQACRFHSICSVPLAKDPSGPCLKSPWKSFDRRMGEGCWYAAGVRCARGYSEVSKDA